MRGQLGVWLDFGEAHRAAGQGPATLCREQRQTEAFKQNKNMIQNEKRLGETKEKHTNVPSQTWRDSFEIGTTRVNEKVLVTANRASKGSRTLSTSQSRLNLDTNEIEQTKTGDSTSGMASKENLCHFRDHIFDCCLTSSFISVGMINPRVVFYGLAIAPIAEFPLATKVATSKHLAAAIQSSWSRRARMVAFCKIGNP
jgi:hypothetical protein